MTDVCLCVSVHAPKPYKLVKHHVIPEAWGGPTTPENLVTICPTCHENIHQLLNQYERLNAEPPWDFLQHFGLYVRHLVELAWAAKPPDAPPIWACPHSLNDPEQS